MSEVKGGSFPPHRHERKSWLIAGGWIEWCYVCGAWRMMRQVDSTGVCPDGPWNKPSGDPSVNPAMAELSSLRTEKRAKKG